VGVGPEPVEPSPKSQEYIKESLSGSEEPIASNSMSESSLPL